MNGLHLRKLLGVLTLADHPSRRMVTLNVSYVLHICRKSCDSWKYLLEVSVQYLGICASPLDFEL